MAWGVYDEFIETLEVDDRTGQRKAVDLLIDLSDSSDIETYSIQAPTGTGKSYAALLAGVHNARKGLRTVIGTSTVVLSDQYRREVSKVERVFPEVEFSILKGAANYFCGNKAGAEIRLAKTAKRRDQLMTQLKLAAGGGSAQIPVWARADTEFCSSCIEGLRKKGTSDCEYAKAREDARAADVVVTTHAMISVDMKMEGHILGDVHLTIFDEAHKASASLIYAESLGAGRIKKLDFNGILLPMSHARRGDLVMHFEMMKEDSYQHQWKWYAPTAQSVAETDRVWPTTLEILQMRDRVKTASDNEKFDLGVSVEFLAKGREVLEEIKRGDINGGIAMWLAQGSYKLQDMIPEPKIIKALSERRVAWMSATIGTHSRPTYSLDKCGIKTKFYSLPSPFNYADQLEWVVRPASSSMPEADLISAVNNHWNGGCVVLTGSHRRKERIAELLRIKNPGLLIQEQTLLGNEGNKAALQAHCDLSDLGGNPILIGVEIFSTGVDLPGKQLTKLVIAGLFPMRDDAGYANWRGRWLESLGGDKIEDYELPERAIALEQQIGRVIRTTSDKGVVVFYVDDNDWVPGSKGRRVIEEALRRFDGAVGIGV